MASIPVKVAKALLAKKGKVARGHRPQAGPHFGAVVIRSVRIKLLRRPFHECEIGRFVVRVVAGEFRRCGDANTIAEAGNGDQIVFVDGRDSWRQLVIADRYSQGIAFDWINRQSDANPAHQDRTVRSKREHIDVAREVSLVGRDPSNYIARILDQRYRL